MNSGGSVENQCVREMFNRATVSNVANKGTSHTSGVVIRMGKAEKAAITPKRIDGLRAAQD